MGHTIVVGRRTWDSLPASSRCQPAKCRTPSRQAGFMASGAEVVSSSRRALTSGAVIRPDSLCAGAAVRDQMKFEVDIVPARDR